MRSDIRQISPSEPKKVHGKQVPRACLLHKSKLHAFSGYLVHVHLSLLNAPTRLLPHPAAHLLRHHPPLLLLRLPPLLCLIEPTFQMPDARKYQNRKQLATRSEDGVEEPTT